MFIAKRYWIINQTQKGSVNDNYQITRDISYGPNDLQTFDIYSPENTFSTKTKVIILIHGGSWTHGDKSSMEDLLIRIQNTNPNYTIVNMNYVLANDNTYAFPNQFYDIDAVLNKLTLNQNIYNIIPEFALVGRSAGGHLALTYDYTHDKRDRVKVVCSIAGPTDFTHSFFQNDPSFEYLFNMLVDEKAYTPFTKLLNKLSPAYQVSRKSSPTIIFHGTNDTKVPFDNAEKLEKVLNNNNIPKKLLIFDEGHSNWGNDTMQIVDNELKLFLENNF